MKYNFDEIIPRHNTNSVKWDLAEKIYGENDILPMWVADMDFRSPQQVIDALNERSAHGIYGYAACTMPYYESIIQWIKMQHNWEIKWEWILFSPGVVPGINMLIQTFTKPGDKVIIQQPVYYPFIKAIKNNGRYILNNSLKLKNNKYYIDLDDLNNKTKDTKAKLLILCSPHNPVGRVWTKDELIQVGEICIENNIMVISDEIHSDLTLKGYKHTPFASISDKFLMNSITCNAPSKTFNLAGLSTSYIIIPDPIKRQEFTNKLESNGIFGPNLFGTIALETAYKYGKEWLEQVIDYIQNNLEFLQNFIKEKIPAINVIVPEATYLVWLDFRNLGLDKYALKDLILKKGKVALEDGYIFGDPEGDGFQRINIACPRALLEQGLKRIENAVKYL